MRFRIINAVLVVMVVVFLFSCGGGGGGGSSSSSGIKPSTNSRSVSFSFLLPTFVGRSRTSSGSSGIIYSIYVKNPSNGRVIYQGSVGDNSTPVVADIPNGLKKVLIVVRGGNFVPWQKIVDISSTSIALKPQFNEGKLIKVSSNIAQLKTNKRLLFGLNRDGQPFLSSSSRNNGFTGRVYVELPDGVLPDNNTVIAQMQYFNGDNVSVFPGRFEGEGYSGASALAFQSLVFAYTGLKDENGNDIALKNGKKFTGGEACSDYSYTVSIPLEYNAVLKDDDNNTSNGIQIPAWGFEEGKWYFIGESSLYYDNGSKVFELDNSSHYYAKFCSPTYYNWFSLGYTMPQGSKTICVSVKDNNGKSLSGIYLYVKGRNNQTGYAYYGFNNRLIIPYVPDENPINYIKDNYGFYYDFWQIGAFDVEIPADNNLEKVDNSSCDYLLSVTVDNPLTAKARIKIIDENNKAVTGRSVWLESSNSRYYASGTTGDDGAIIVDVAKETVYRIKTDFGEKSFKVDGEVDYDELCDNGSIAGVKIVKTNQPPQITIWASTTMAKVKKPVTVWVTIFDPDKDKIIIKKSKWGSGEISPSKEQCGDGYCFLQFDNLTSNEEDNVTFSIEVGDSKLTKTAELPISFYSNRPPIIEDIKGPAIISLGINPDGKADFSVLAYDLDADNLTYSVSLEPSSQCSGGGSNNNFECYFSMADNYTLTFNVSDGEHEKERSVVLEVVDDIAPTIESAYFSKTDILQGEDDNITVWASDSDSENLLLKVVDEDNQTYTADCVKTIEDGFKCVVAIPTENLHSGEYNYVVSVSDGRYRDNKTLTLFVGNRPPQIVSGLDNVTLTAGDTHTFSVIATDPDGDVLSYEWYVNGQKQSETSDNFTYTFDSEGNYTVKVVVSDGKDSVSSQCNVEVNLQLKLNLGLKDVAVSILDSQLNIVETHYTNASGVVKFDDVDNDKVNLAITFSPDTVISRYWLFEDVVDKLMNLCHSPQFLDNCRSYSVLKKYEWKMQYKVPVAFLDIFTSDNRGGGEITPGGGSEVIGPPNPLDNFTSTEVNDADNNSDGYLNANELYDMFVKKYDSNDDNELEGKELSDKGDIKTEIIMDFPVKHYSLKDLFNDSLISYNDYGYYYDTNRKLVWVNIDNVYQSYFLGFAAANDWGCVFSSQTHTGNCAVILPVQNDGKWSVITGFEDSGYFWGATVQDTDSDNLTLGYDNFSQASQIDLENWDNQSSVSLSILHNGVEYNISSFVYSDSGASLYIIDNTTQGEYLLSLSESTGSNDNNTDRFYDHVYTGNSLPSYIDVSFYKNALLDVNLEIDNESFSISGDNSSDINTIIVNRTWYSYSGSSYLIKRYIFDDGNITSVDFVNPSQVLPSDIYNNYVKPILDNVSGFRGDITVFDVENLEWGNFNFKKSGGWVKGYHINWQR